MLYDLPGSDGGRVAVMVSHVEVQKFLICFTDTYPKGRKQSKFDPGSETRCKFSCDPDGIIAVEARDNTRRVKGAMIDASRRGELTTLCSITGFVLDCVAFAGSKVPIDVVGNCHH